MLSFGKCEKKQMKKIEMKLLLPASSHHGTARKNSLTTKCWKSHALITLVACFGKIPRFCRFEPELLEKFELKSSLFESTSDSASSELLQGDNWSAAKCRKTT